MYTKCKNISMKILKDVGITVPKGRETSAVYTQHSCAIESKTRRMVYNGTRILHIILHLFLYFLALLSLHSSTFS